MAIFGAVFHQPIEVHVAGEILHVDVNRQRP